MVSVVKAAVRSRISRRFFFRILAILMTLSLLPYLIFNLFFMTRVKSELTANTRLISQQEMAKTADRISQSMGVMQQVLFYISTEDQSLLENRSTLKDLDIVATMHYLDTLSQLASIANNKAVYLCLYDSQNDILIASDYGVTSCAGNPRFNWLPEEIKIAAGSGRIYMTPARLNYVSSQGNGYFSAIIQPANPRAGLKLTAMFFIDMQGMMETMLSGINTSSSAYTCYMINRDGSIIYHPDQHFIATRLDPAIMATLTATGTYDDAGPVVLNALPIAGTAMTLVTEIDTKVLYGWVDRLNRQLLLVTGIIMTLLILAAIFLSIVLYRPVLAVLKRLSSSRPGQSASTGEFEYIRSAFDQIEGDYQHAADNLESTRQVLHRTTLLNSIKGGLDIEPHGLGIPQTSSLDFAVLVVFTENLTDLHDIQDWLTRQIIGVEIFNEDKSLLCIFPGNGILPDLAAKLRVECENQPDLLVAICQEGRPLNNLYRSYYESTFTGLINSLLGKHGVVRFQDLFRSPEIEHGLPANLRKDLQKSISHFEAKEFTAQVMDLLPSGLSVTEFNHRVASLMILLIELQPEEAPLLISDFVDRFRQSDQLDPQRIRRYFIQNFRETASRHSEESSSLSAHLQVMNTFIEQNYDKLISLDDVVQAVGVSKQYFCYLIKKAYNMTYTNYLNHYRIEKAKILLQDPAIRVDQINNRVGFSSASYFIKVFKQNTGLTPGDFRRIINSGQLANKGAHPHEETLDV